MSIPVPKIINKMKNSQSIGNRFEEIRAKEGISRQRFAERIGCTTEFIRMIEHGTRTPKEPYILAVCYRFGVREKWLKEGKGRRKA